MNVRTPPDEIGALTFELCSHPLDLGVSPLQRSVLRLAAPLPQLGGLKMARRSLVMDHGRLVNHRPIALHGPW